MQTDPPPPVSSQYVQTDMVVVKGVVLRLYTSVAAESDPVIVYDSGSGSRPVPPEHGLGPPLIGSRPMVVHGFSCQHSLLEIL